MSYDGILSPLAQPGFLRYFVGQVVTNIGTWFQNLALSLVVLDATGSAQALGGVTFAQFLPILLLSVHAGRIVDRVSSRAVLLIGAALSAVVVSLLAVVVSADTPSLIAVYGLVACLGAVNAFERVAAQAIIRSLVNLDRLGRAVSLSTIAVAAGRSIGPGLAGLLFQAAGPVVCLLANAVSFLLVFVLLLFVHPHEEHLTLHLDLGPGRLGGVLQDPSLRLLLVVNAVIALLALNLNIVLTSVVALTFDGSATSVGLNHALNAVGAVAGGLVATALPRVSTGMLAAGCALLGATLFISALPGTLAAFLVLAPVLGLGFGFYTAVINAVAQAAAPAQAVGRVMALMLLGNVGMAPFGGLISGWVIDRTSGQVSLLTGAAVALTCAFTVALHTLRRGENLLDARPDHESEL
jgi:MFS family permease